ncbi:MAG: cell division protein FtsW [Hyphomicrobiaceae bacterium]|jgi:cell division protein FtsW
MAKAKAANPGPAMAKGQRVSAYVTRADRVDPWIAWLTAALVVCGTIFVFGTSYFFSSYNYDDSLRMFWKHLFSIGVGVVLAVLLSRGRSESLERWALAICAVAAVLLALTLVPGVGACAKGACRWLDLKVLRFQPAEFAKIGFVIFSASVLTRFSDKLKWPHYGMLPVLGMVGLFGVLLLKQPDFGTTALLGVIGVALMFLAGVPAWQVLGLCTIMAKVGYELVKLEPYRMKRLMVFLDPAADPKGMGWQLNNALIAFGSGQVTGQGLGASTQKSGYLPEAHTDFIFSVIGEETGLIGGLFVLVCFGLLGWRGFRVAYKHPARFGQILAAGITLLIVMQAMLNMGVVLGLLPTKGIGMPYISYGGSSMMIFLAMTGMLLALSRELRDW